MLPSEWHGRVLIVSIRVDTAWGRLTCVRPARSLDSISASVNDARWLKEASYRHPSDVDCR